MSFRRPVVTNQLLPLVLIFKERAASRVRQKHCLTASRQESAQKPTYLHEVFGALSGYSLYRLRSAAPALGTGSLSTYPSYLLRFSEIGR